MSDLAVELLDQRSWPAFEELLDAGGPASRCWCMAWRIGPSYRERAASRNRAEFRSVVAAGPSPGLVSQLLLHS